MYTILGSPVAIYCKRDTYGSTVHLIRGPSALDLESGRIIADAHGAHVLGWLRAFAQSIYDT